MRKAVICVGFMLAVLQLWPLVFGQRSAMDVASPGAQAAVVIPVPRRVTVIATLPKPVPVAASATRTSRWAGIATQGVRRAACRHRYSTGVAPCLNNELGGRFPSVGKLR